MISIRIVFMGSPEFAIPTLTFLAKSYAVVGVVTQPDRPAARGRILTPPPVKELALQLNIPVFQPQRLKEELELEQLRVWQPDLIVVAAFGQILRPVVLNLPKFGCINVHASLLPRWRGAAPIPAAILHGDQQTGISIMQMDAGIDTGPILSQKSLDIAPEDDNGSLSHKLSELGAELLIEKLPGYLSGEIIPQPQDHTQATSAPMLKKEDGLLDFKHSADDLARMVRAYTLWPGAYTFWNGQRLIIHKARAVKSDIDHHKPIGFACVYDQLPSVVAQDGILVFSELQPAGKKIMTGRDFLQGARKWDGSILS